MSKIDYQALRAKAEKATCGEWSLEYGEGRFDGDDALIHREAAGYIPICRIEGAHPESGFDEDFQMEQQANAEFIAAANPATVLALLDELEAAEKRIAELESLTVPQLPQQAVPDEMPEPDTARMFFTDAVVAIAKVQGWNACRAAMLHSAEPVSQAYKLNALDGNSPVTPDGLLGCGENCWSCGKYFTYEQHSECDGYCPHCNSPVDLDDEEDQPSKVVPTNPTEEMISNAWREAIGKCDHETIKRIYATMLAAAPQQEVN
ncbi:ead/Ea22-like family protein [Escherichia coli]|nr:ead/Ea22-like family protein [Escherichia coli]